jgi:hypothetical protein
MKKKFIAKGQTRFDVPFVAWNKDNSMRQGTRAFKLAVGQTVKVRDTYTDTDEGYSAVREFRTNKNGVLHRDIQTDSRDCDGRMSGHKEQRLVDGKWTCVTESQRDYEAEKAGY